MASLAAPFPGLAAMLRGMTLLRPRGSTRRAPAHGRIVASNFRAHPLLRNPHLQTLLPGVLRQVAPAPLRHERLELEDGDFVDLGWSGEDAPEAPLAILVHGIGSGFRSKYVCALIHALRAAGWRAVVLQLRGSGPEPNRLPRGYHHGDTDDFRHVCALLRRRFPQAPLAAVGWSLGGSVVLKGLGEDAARSPLDAAVAVSAPLNLDRCAEHLNSSSLARLYEDAMLAYVKRGIRRKHARVPVPEGADLRAALAARDFMALGAAYTAPLNGYRDIKDFCRRAACGPYLGGIARPALVLQSSDDPLLGAAALAEAAMLSPQVTVEMSSHGGHVGFVGSDGRGRPRYWLEPRILEFLQQSLSPNA